MSKDPRSPFVLQGLLKVWSDFICDLEATPFFQKLHRHKLRVEDYRALLINHRQQVIEGSRWIARAASSVSGEFAEQRAMFLKHAIAEHRDYHLLEADYVSVGGELADILGAEKNIGAEALHAFMYQRASERNPFDLLGAMFIIEGLGREKARSWALEIQRQLSLRDNQVSFLLYHDSADAGHMSEFQDVLDSGILAIDGMDRQILKTARIVARLYRLQIEEMGRF